MFRETEYRATGGIPFLLALFVTLALLAWLIVASAQAESVLGVGVGLLLFVLSCVGLGGLVVVNPNEAKVLTLFGRYVGSVRKPGLWFVNPFMSKKKVSLRIRNFETARLKVNDSHSNPVEIGAIVVWKVVDSAEAMFEVEDYVHFVQTQSEAAVRALAQSYPYDAHEDGQISLSTHTAEVSEALLDAIRERLAKAGVEVIESRISHLAYAQEIASAMLRRQQASAVIAARQKIVEGAVGMVETALEMLSSRQVITLDEERKAAMVSNLLVVLCSDRDTQPVVNTGSLYQ
jgi:regulator of protease activity HflC (stomatin/prohibitin superfamily)